MINKLAEEVHSNAVEKGFYDKPQKKNTGEMLCLIHSEVSEALEADRKGKYVESSIYDINECKHEETFNAVYEEEVKGRFEEEMADIVIRVMDLCCFKDIDLEAHIIAKMRFNRSREKYHGKKY